MDGRKLVELASDGFPVASTNAQSVVAYLARLEAVNRGRLPRARISSHLGWQGKDGEAGFLWGKALLSPDGDQAAEVDLDEIAPGDWREDWITFRGMSAGDEQIAAGYHASGDYDGWLRAVRVVANHPRALLVFYTSFVPPLLAILRAPNFILDVANRTTTGKTIAARVAASVWGKPDERAPDGALWSWDATRVWAERASAVLSGLPLILDDTKRAKARGMVAELLYSVANGRGRGRGNTHGLARTRTWRTILISTGEAPATSFTQDGGTRMRCLELRGIPFGRDDADTRRLVDLLNLGIQAHYGHAGPLFVRWLLREREKWEAVAKFYRKTCERLATEAGTAEGGRFAQYGAAIEVAAGLVHKAFDLPWEFAEPLRAVWEGVIADATDAAGEVRALRDVLSWASARNQAFYGRHQVDRDGNARMPSNGWAGRWNSGDDWQYLAFFPTQLHRALSDLGYEPEAIIPGWRERGWLDTELGRITKKVRADGEPERMIVIHRFACDEVQV
jgi:hypothetical protein